MYRGNCLKRALHIFKVGGAWQKKEGDVFSPSKTSLPLLCQAPRPPPPLPPQFTLWNVIKITDWLKIDEWKSFGSFGNITNIQKVNLLKVGLIELYRTESSWYQYICITLNLYFYQLHKMIEPKMELNTLN